MARSREEIIAEITAIRERVLERYPQADLLCPSSDGDAEIPPLIDLMALFHARDAAEGKVAAVGKVNPRRGGPVNAIIQLAKRSVARTLGWFVRDQVDFNAATVRAITETMEALNEVNRSIANLAARDQRLHRRCTVLDERINTVAQEADAHLRDATDDLSDRIQSVRLSVAETARGIHELQTGTANLSLRLGNLDASVAANAETLRSEAAAAKSEREREDIRLLRTLADIQKAVQQQLARAERELRDSVEQRGNLAEERSRTYALQTVEHDHRELEALVHRELRLLRQRVGAILERNGPSPDATAVAAVAGESGFFDSVRFSDRFRGTEDEVREKLRIYLPHFADCNPVFDLGCGRGEFLDLLRDKGIAAVGVESNAELAGIVAAKGHRAYHGDLFEFLETQSPESAGGVFCAHVIEHLPAEALASLIAGAYRTLRSGGILALETPNPACLAIFSTYFFLDPTHIRPVPAEFVRYLLEETGFTGVRVMGIHPAVDDFEALKPLDDGFRQQFFGHLDYGVIAQKP